MVGCLGTKIPAEPKEDEFQFSFMFCWDDDTADTIHYFFKMGGQKNEYRDS
jgi:hypothetical protein